MNTVGAGIVASVIFASGLQADDNRARMVKDKIKNQSASELSQEYPSAGKNAQSSEVLKKASNENRSQIMEGVSALVEMFWSFLNANPEFRDEAMRIGTEYMKEAKKAETNNTSILPIPNHINTVITNSHSESK